jgi:hypothetical protein
VIPAGQANTTGLAYTLRILTMGDVEVHRMANAFTSDGISFPAGSWVIPMRQPYAGFAQTMLEVQHYPDLREYPGGPPRRPYDVTAHTLPYLMDIEAIEVSESVDLSASEIIDVPDFDFHLPDHLLGPAAPRVGVYKSWQEPMEAGWTRWVFDKYGMQYDTLHDADVREGDLADRYDVILLQDQDAGSIVSGFDIDEVPEGYSGGLGDTGVEALRSFVQSGGRLVAIEEAVDFVTETFGLQISNAVEDLPNTDFYIPGSILRLELESTSPLARGLDAEAAAWYWRSSRAFDVSDVRARVAARYGTGDPLLSGWVLGGEHVAGKPAIVEADIGEGSVVLFGFQPNYRAQTVATWPLLFNAFVR